MGDAKEGGRIAIQSTFRAALLTAALLVSATVYAADPPAASDSAVSNSAVSESARTESAGTGAAPQPCSDHVPQFPSCGISAADARKADALYRQAEKLLQNRQFDEALQKLSAARAISPKDVFFAGAEKLARAQAAAGQVRLGNQALLTGDTTAALAAFRRTLELDPGNVYAAERLHDALPRKESRTLPAADMGQLRLKPLPGTRSFEFRGPSPMAMEKFAALFGIAAVADASLTPRNVRIKLDHVDWQTGSRILQRVCKVLLVPLGEQQVVVANDTEQNRRDLVPITMRTFYIEGESSPQSLTDLTSALRTLFDLRFIANNPSKNAITILATQEMMDAVERFVEDLRNDRPSVMMEVQIFQVSTRLTRDLGTSVPTQFTVFNVPTEVQKLVGSGSFQQVLAALQASGQSVSASTLLAGLLASSSSSPLAQPFATFGGGITLSAVTIPATSLRFNESSSLARTVDDVLLRSENGSAATMKAGARYPIATTVYSATSVNSSILSSLGLSGASAAATSAAAIPSPQFAYEDLGLVLKATPRVHGKLVSLEYELSLRAIGATQAKGPPTLTNRESKGVISTEDGRPVVIAGLVGKSEMEAINGIPLLSALPVLGKAFSVETKERFADDLLIVITPHIVSARGARGIYVALPANAPK